MSKEKKGALQLELVIAIAISVIGVVVIGTGVINPGVTQAKTFFDKYGPGGSDSLYQGPGEFVPFTPILSDEEQTVMDSIDALRCAFSFVGSGKIQSEYCGSLIKDVEKREYCCCQKTITADGKSETKTGWFTSCKKSQQEEAKENQNNIKYEYKKIDTQNGLCDGKKDPSDNLICCKKRAKNPGTASDSQWIYNWGYGQKCNDNDEKYVYEEVEVPYGGKCGNLADIRNTIKCKPGEYSFGQTCVECREVTKTISTNKQEAIEEITQLIYQCWVKGEPQKKDIFCSKITKDRGASYPITTSDIEKALESKGLGDIDLDGSVEFGSGEETKYLVGDDDYFYEMHFVNEDECKNYEGYDPKSINTLDLELCKINHFELPQDVSEYGYDNKDEDAGWWEGWMSSYKAPEYILYYEAFEPREEMIWKEDLGAVSAGAMWKAAATNAIFSLGGEAVGALAKGATKLAWKTSKISFKFGSAKISGTVKRFTSYFSTKMSTKLTPKKLSDLLKITKEYNQLIKELGSEEKALRKVILESDDAELKALYKKLDDSALDSMDSDTLIKKITESDRPDVVIDDFKLDLDSKNRYNLVSNHQNAWNKIEDIVKLTQKDAIAKYVKMYDELGKYYKNGVFDEALFQKELAKTAKAINDMNEKQIKKLLDEIEDEASLGMIDDTTHLSSITGKEFVSKQQIMQYQDVIEKVFLKESVNLPYATGNFKKFLSSLNELANKIPSEKVKNARYITQKYGFFLLYMLGTQREGVKDKFEGHGLNSIVLDQPWLLGQEPVSFDLPSVANAYVFLDKGQEGDGDLGAERPRFYLASPCLTNITVTKTNCYCVAPSGSVVLNEGNSKIPINGLAGVKESAKEEGELENHHKYFYDSLNPDSQNKVKEACINKGYVSVSSKSSSCFMKGFGKDELRDIIFDYYYEVVAREALAEAKKSSQKDVLNDYITKYDDSILVVNNIFNYGTKYTLNKKESPSLGSLLKAIAAFNSKRSLTISNSYYEQIDSDVRKNLNQVSYEFADFIFSPITGTRVITINKNTKTIEHSTYSAIEVGKTIKMSKDISSLVDNSKIKIMDHDGVEKDASIMSIDEASVTFIVFGKGVTGDSKLPDKELMKKWFISVYEKGMVLNSQGQDFVIVSYADVFSTLFNNYMTYKHNTFEMAQGGDSKFSNLIEKLARNSYYNYYEFNINEVEMDKVVKSCDNLMMYESKEASSLFGTQKDYHSFKANCVDVRPEAYRTYGQTYVPNYCFTSSTGSSEFWRTAMNVFWVGVDIGVGIFTGPLGTLALSTVTGGLQYQVDQWLLEGEHWPQHKD